jgi:hypothetical protein
LENNPLAVGGVAAETGVASDVFAARGNVLLLTAHWRLLITIGAS